jgi:alkane 1-monooxygenase
MTALRFSLPFLFLATVPLGFALGGAWAFLTLATVPLGLTAFDALLGFDARPVERAERVAFPLLPWLYIPLQIAVIVGAAVVIGRGYATPVEAVGLTVSVGLTAGVFGLVAAHEMVHSPNAAERALGLTMLAMVGYMQFRIAHIHGHHARAATFEDPATARRGESAYGFVVRSVAGQTVEAWRFENERLRRASLRAWGPANRMLRYLMIEAVVVGGMACLGWRAVAFFVAQSLIAIMLLELFNYIAHYGLRRRVLPSGTVERLAPKHSWNSTRRMNNWSLFNMGRHSDHHRFAARRYASLEAMPDAPELPTGYAGAILMALVPPLWRRVMDPRVEAWGQE